MRPAGMGHGDQAAGQGMVQHPDGRSSGHLGNLAEQSHLPTPPRPPIHLKAVAGEKLLPFEPDWGDS